MVRASSRPVAAIAGGFVLIPLGELMTAWAACQARPLGLAHFGAWLACRELVARRRGPAGREPHYAPGEVAALLGRGERRARACLRGLEAAGLLAWSASGISFPGAQGADADRPVTPLGDSIGRGRGSLVVPRRLLRFLCRATRPAVVAATFAILCRCLSRRESGFDGEGRVKAAWIADAFGISLRQAKSARAELVRIGWIEERPSDAWARRRWGSAYRIDLDWSPEAPEARGGGVGPTSTPQAAPAGPTSTPLDLQTGTPSGGEKHQDPGGPGPAGVRPGKQGGGGSGPPTPPPPPPPTPPPTPAPTPPPPRLDDVTVEDLRDDGRLLELHRQAVARRVVTPSEADRHRFAAAAEHALAVGESNPAGLFAYLVRGGRWRHLTQADEDAARKRRRFHGRPDPPDPGTPAATPMGGWGRPAGPSADALLVREVRTAVIRAGIFRDPWPAFASKNPAWDRPRWDRALAELGLA